MRYTIAWSVCESDAPVDELDDPNPWYDELGIFCGDPSDYKEAYAYQKKAANYSPSCRF